jgi:cation:H+ antiporter
MVLLLAASFVLVIGGALLFTNSVEWAGRRLGLGEGAVGSLLAAVATALPESAIPAVAIISGGDARHTEIAIGSIIGAPFLLGTLAMAMVGASALAFRGRREQGRRIEARMRSARRDLLVFVGFFAVAIGIGAAGTGRGVRIALAVALVAGYGVYTWWTIRTAGEPGGEELDSLYFDWTTRDPPSNVQIAAQFIVALAAIVGGAELFVQEVERAAESLGVGLLGLALVLAPLATELPEKANSILWMRSGKDTLALGNISGAMVFQASLPVSVGLAFTDWSLSTPALMAGAVGIGGGLLAAWRLGRRDFGPVWMVVWLVAYAGFAAYALAH